MYTVLANSSLTILTNGTVLIQTRVSKYITCGITVHSTYGKEC